MKGAVRGKRLAQSYESMRITSVANLSMSEDQEEDDG